MNFREVLKTCKSPGVKAFLACGLLILLVILTIPYFVTPDEKNLEVVKPDDVDKKPIIIETKIPALKADKSFVAPRERPKVLETPKSDEIKAAPDSASSQKTAPLTRKEFSSDSDSESSSPVGRRKRTHSDSGMLEGRANAQILLIDGENDGKNNTENEIFLSDRYAPFGRLLSCKLVNTLESNIPNTPVIAIVTESLFWQNSNGEKQLIIPAGTEILGTCGSASRNRLNTGTSWILVWQISSPGNMVGYEMQIQGIALEKSHQPGRKDLAAISDMSAGIPGQVIENKTLDELLMVAFGALQGAAQGAQQNEVYETENSTIVSNNGSTRNMVSMAIESAAQILMQQVADRISKESYYIRVAAGTDFYVYVTQVIDLDQARIANSQSLKAMNKASEEHAKGNTGNVIGNYQNQIQQIENMQPSNRKMIRRQVY